MLRYLLVGIQQYHCHWYQYTSCYHFGLEYLILVVALVLGLSNTAVKNETPPISDETADAASYNPEMLIVAMERVMVLFDRSVIVLVITNISSTRVCSMIRWSGALIFSGLFLLILVLYKSFACLLNFPASSFFSLLIYFLCLVFWE